MSECMTLAEFWVGERLILVRCALAEHTGDVPHVFDKRSVVVGMPMDSAAGRYFRKLRQQG